MRCSLGLSPSLALAALFPIAALACSGGVTTGSGNTSTQAHADHDSGGGGDSSGTTKVAAAGSCMSRPPPLLTLDNVCTSFVPDLGGETLTFVEQTEATGSDNVITSTYRFRAQLDCGFDLLVSLPGLQFAADTTTSYQAGMWWIQGGSASLGIASVNLDLGELVVSDDTESGQPSSIDDTLPATVGWQLSGPLCAGSSTMLSQVLENVTTNASLPCQDETGPVPTRLCQEGATTYRMLVFDSLDVGIYGTSNLLTVNGD